MQCYMRLKTYHIRGWFDREWCCSSIVCAGNDPNEVPAETCSVFKENFQIKGLLHYFARGLTHSLTRNATQHNVQQPTGNNFGEPRPGKGKQRPQSEGHGNRKRSLGRGGGGNFCKLAIYLSVSFASVGNSPSFTSSTSVAMSPSTITGPLSFRGFFLSASPTPGYRCCCCCCCCCCSCCWNHQKGEIWCCGRQNDIPEKRSVALHWTVQGTPVNSTALGPAKTVVGK